MRTGIVNSWRYRGHDIVQRDDGYIYVFNFKSSKINTDYYDPEYAIAKVSDRFSAADFIDNITSSRYQSHTI